MVGVEAAAGFELLFFFRTAVSYTRCDAILYAPFIIDLIPEFKMKDTSSSLLISFHHCCHSRFVVVAAVFDSIDPFVAGLWFEKTESINLLKSFGRSCGTASTCFAMDALVQAVVSAVFSIAILGGWCSSLFSIIVNVAQNDFSKHSTMYIPVYNIRRALLR
jgi:hypothetical protein